MPSKKQIVQDLADGKGFRYMYETYPKTPFNAYMEVIQEACQIWLDLDRTEELIDKSSWNHGEGT